MNKIEDLPNYIEHEFEYEDGTIEKLKCWLTLNRDINGNWSCGYVTWDDEGIEMAIPQLVTNSSKTIDEAAFRMNHKVERFFKIED